MRYDVIVVGAGPSGSTTARECAERGLSVLLIDRAEFPRDKPCGGGVTVRSARIIPFDIAPVVERTVTRMRISYGQSGGLMRVSPVPFMYMTQRRRFDQLLAERAEMAGAQFRQRESIRSVVRSGTRVSVTTSNGVYEAPVLVAADGANGPTARMAGVPIAVDRYVALEGNFTPRNTFPSVWQDAFGIDIGGYPGGYGWLFPKADHLNIGLGGLRHIGPSLRDRLDQLARFYGCDPASMWGVRGHHLPVRRSHSPVVDGNVVLVGDAAGVVDPITAEGIHNAMWTGREAAASIAEHLEGNATGLQSYQEQLDRVLFPDLALARQLHSLFNLSPRLVAGVEKMSGALFPAVVRILRGERGYADVAHRLGPAWPALSAIANSVPKNPLLRRIANLSEREKREKHLVRRT